MTLVTLLIGIILGILLGCILMIWAFYSYHTVIKETIKDYLEKGDK